MSQVQTALSNTTISGYVDTSIQWNAGTGNSYVAPVSFQNALKADGFNLNVVDLALDKPLDESPWAAGYHVELWFGPDANLLGTDSNPYANPYVGADGSYPGPYYYGNEGASDFAIRQAYVALRTPLGNSGIDWKLGVFDSPLGYESTSSVNNPFYTRSYGYTIEPSELTGLQATFKANDMFSATVGIADTLSPMINGRAFAYYEADYYSSPTKAESFKTYFAAATLTAPDSWGWLSGSTLTAGFITGDNPGAAFEGYYAYGAVVQNYYVGATIATPVKGLKAGFAWDYRNMDNYYEGYHQYDWTAALYATYQVNDKLSISGRGDYWKNYYGDGEVLWSLTGDVQYNLWQNVITRLEVRWDKAEHDSWFGGTKPGYQQDSGYGYSYVDGTSNLKQNSFMVALQVIYQF